MDGTPLKGKTCLITGATNGHGKALAKILAGLGADIIILGRNREKCSHVQESVESLTGIRPDALVCDLSSLDDVRSAAGEFISWNRPLHILINNAGVVNREFLETVDGYEATFAVNYLSMFLLTNLLLDCMKKSAPARIINIASDAHRIAALNPDDPEGRNKRYSIMGAYGRSKLAILYFTRELAARIEGTGVTVNAVDPGPIASGIAKKPGLMAKVADGIIQKTFPKPEKAAQTALYMAISPDVAGENGEYYRFMKKKEPKFDKAIPDCGSRLWDISVEMTGLAQ